MRLGKGGSPIQVYTLAHSIYQTSKNIWLFRLKFVPLSSDFVTSEPCYKLGYLPGMPLTIIYNSLYPFLLEIPV